MELKSFVSETIKQITDGVLEGSSYIKGKSKSEEGIKNGYTEIDFDIAVTINEESREDIGGKISVVQVFNAGAGSHQSSSKISQNRIKFKIMAAISTK